MSRTGEERRIRMNMIEDNVIDSVILLPPNLFKNTLIKTCIIILKKNKRQSDILFIDASNEYEKGKLRNKMGKENLEHILEWFDRRETIEGISYVAAQQEVLEKDGNLSVMKYVTRKKENEKIDLRELRAQIRVKEQQLEMLKDKKEYYLCQLRKEGNEG